MLLALVSPAMAGIATNTKTLTITEDEEGVIDLMIYPVWQDESELVRVDAEISVCDVELEEFILDDNPQRVSVRCSGEAGDYSGNVDIEHSTYNEGGTGITSTEAVKITVEIEPAPTPTPTSSSSGGTAGGFISTPSSTPTPTSTSSPTPIITSAPVQTLTPDPEETKVENRVYGEDAVIPTPTPDTRDGGVVGWPVMIALILVGLGITIYMMKKYGRS